MRGWTVGAMMALACVVASCASGAAPITTPVAPGAPARVEQISAGPSPGTACAQQTPPAAGVTTSLSGVKAPVLGLVDLGQVSVVDMPEPPVNTLYFICQRQDQLSGIVVNDTWASLQSSAGARIDTAPIDQALRAIRQYNASSSHHLRVRLRIWAGYDAPNWAKSIGGPPVVICNQYAAPSPAPSSSPSRSPRAAPTPCPASAQRTVGRFWSNAYDVAWQGLQRQLATKYDGESIVSEVAVSSCSSLSSEPFVQSEDLYSVTSLRAAGYTDGAYERCLAKAIQRDYAPFWHDTPIVYSFNPMRLIDVRPPVSDLAFTKSVIAGCRRAIGSRCVLFNETMAKYTPPPAPQPGQSPSVAQTYYQMWRFMHLTGGPIGFQTAAPPNLLLAWGTNAAGWSAAVSLAHRFGASSLEIFPPKNNGPCTTATRSWVAGYTCFSAQTLTQWKRKLETKP